jgi:hypothetical protein
MATIEFTNADSSPWVRTRDVLPPERHAEFGDGELASESRNHHDGGPGEMQLFEVRAPANAKFRAHAHNEDEIILVVEGELHAGSHVVAAGGTMRVPARTLYAFSTGPEGVRFFNFRGRRDQSYITPAQLRELQQAARAE